MAGYIQDMRRSAKLKMPPELEDKIKDLCAKAVKAEGKELETVLTDLREALREQSKRARGMVEDLKRRTNRRPE
jgi:hypothetical protein